MYCMKCGRETKSDQVFCDGCLEVMRQHPVKPGTFIQLPSRPAPTVPKKAQPRKRVIPLEEQVQKMRKLIVWLGAALIVAVLCLVMSISLLAQSYVAEDAVDTIGQNYNTAEGTD